jgi:hypothetical protein
MQFLINIILTIIIYRNYLHDHSPKEIKGITKIFF